MPNLSWTYTSLFAALQSWPVHASAQYLDDLPNIIALGERRLWGDLNLEEYDETDKSSIQMVAGIRSILKPADVIQLRTVGYYVSSGGSSSEAPKLSFVYLDQRSSEYCQMFAPDSSVQAPPRFYNELTFDHIEVVPTPDKAYQMYYRYIGVLPESLSSSAPNASTWLARAGSDALLSACLAEAEQYIKADDRYQDYMQKYNNELLPRLRAELRKSIRAGDYAPLKPAAGIAQ